MTHSCIYPFSHKNTKRFHFLCKLSNHNPSVGRKHLPFFMGGRYITCH